MRKIVLQMMSTLNGRVDDPDAWLTGFSDELYSDIDRLYAGFDTVLVGRVTYQEMLGYWPSAEAEEGISDANRSMARRTNSYKKYMISRSSEPQKLEWNNSEHVVLPNDEEVIQFVNTLKSQPGSDIHLVGGASLAQTFVRLGLVDEYRFFVYPVVSQGRTCFDELVGKQELELIDKVSYADGVVGLFYKLAV